MSLHWDFFLLEYFQYYSNVTHSPSYLLLLLLFLFSIFKSPAHSSAVRQLCGPRQTSLENLLHFYSQAPGRKSCRFLACDSAPCCTDRKLLCSEFRAQIKTTKPTTCATEADTRCSAAARSEMSPGGFKDWRQSVKRRNCVLFCKLWQSVLLFLKKYLQRRYHLTKQQGWQLYLWVCRAVPVDDVVVQFLHFLPHGAVVSGQRVGDVDVQVVSSKSKSHFPRRTQSSWWEILEKILDTTKERFRVISFSPFIWSFSSNNLISIYN